MRTTFEFYRLPDDAGQGIDAASDVLGSSRRTANRWEQSVTSPRFDAMRSLDRLVHEHSPATSTVGSQASYFIDLFAVVGALQRGFRGAWRLPVNPWCRRRSISDYGEMIY